MTPEVLNSDPSAPLQVREGLFAAIKEYPFQVAGQIAHECTEHSGLETEQGRLTLAALLHTHLMLEPILREKEKLRVAGFFDETGGPPNNRHIKIDEYGKRALEFQAKNFPFTSSASLRIEETHAWTNPLNSGSPECYIVMDPLDESSSADKIDKLVQSAGIIIADKDGQLIAGGIANLVGKEIIMIEKGNLHVFVILGSPDKPKEITLNKIDPENIPQVDRVLDGKIHYAMLGRRVKGIKQTMFYHEQTLALDMFGGFGIHKLLDGTIDAAIDTAKGQPWYEAVIWGWIAREMGYTVIGINGKPIDFQALLLRNNEGADPINPEDLERVKIIIAKTPEIADQIRLRLSSPTVYPFGIQTYL